jgi:membrane protein implicated in regulation of membrane protease activity
MQYESHDWTVPAPLRALLWWPPVALVVAVIEPSAAAGSIAAAGAVLAVLGVLVATVGRAVTRRHGGRTSASVRALAAGESVATAAATVAGSVAVERQAA